MLIVGRALDTSQEAQLPEKTPGTSSYFLLVNFSREICRDRVRGFVHAALVCRLQ